MEGKGPAAAVGSTADQTASGERLEAVSRVDHTNSQKVLTARTTALSVAEAESVAKEGRAEGSWARASRPGTGPPCGPKNPRLWPAEQSG
jgi:hypothetical protein